MTITTTVNSTVLDTIDPAQGFAKVRVSDTVISELLVENIKQLMLISLKLNCLQPGDEEIGITDLDLAAEDF